VSLVEVYPWTPGRLPKLRELATAPFSESRWREKIEALGWRLQADKYHPTEFYISERRPKSGFAGIRFRGRPQLSLWPARVNHFTLNAENTPAFAAAFEQVDLQACAEIGEPDHRLSYMSFWNVRFRASVWCCGPNDLYLMQEVGDQHAGDGAVIELRIVPALPQPVELPLDSVFSS
jgi:hypothetical protein